MDTVTVDSKIQIRGLCLGQPSNSALEAPISITRLLSMTQGGTVAAGTLCDQVLDQAENVISLTAGTTTLNLQNFTNPLIEGSQSFARVRVIYFEHDIASVATSITIFGVAGDSFQGPLSAAATEVLLPGDVFFKRSGSSTGWVVDAGHRSVTIVVAGGTASLRYFFAGSKT